MISKREKIFIKLLKEKTDNVYNLDRWDVKYFYRIFHINGNSILAKNFPDYMDIWWDKDKFGWMNGSEYLCKYCNSKFKLWWDSKHFPWHFYSKHLTMYCSEYISIWWNPDKFNWEHNTLDLIENCYQYAYIWFDDFMERDNKCRTLILNVDIDLIIKYRTKKFLDKPSNISE